MAAIPKNRFSNGIRFSEFGLRASTVLVLIYVFNCSTVISASTTASTTPERGGIIRLPAEAHQGPDSGSWRAAAAANENQVISTLPRCSTPFCSFDPLCDTLMYNEGQQGFKKYC